MATSPEQLGAAPTGQNHLPQRRKITRNPAAAYVVLAIGIALSIALAAWTARLVERESRQKLESAAADARAAIDARIRAYADLLLGVRGLFGARQATRDEFKRYIDSFDLGRRFPGAQVIHFSRRVSAAEKQGFEAAVRADTSIEPRGYPDFGIRPPGDRPEYVVAQYVEPMTGNERALGLDLGGDAARLVALEHTRDSGELTASGPIALAQDPQKHPGFSMRLAIYRRGAPVSTLEQRREAFTGVVSASFVVVDLMQGVLSKQFLQKVHVRIYDAGFLDSPGGLLPAAPENLMFDSDRLRAGPTSASPDEGAAASTAVSALDMGGRRWNIQIRARPGFIDASDRWPPLAALLLGVVISLLLFGLIRSIVSVGARAVAIANRMTADLQKSEETLRATNERLRMLVQSSPLAIYTRDIDGLLTSWNPAAEKMFGWAAAEVLGRQLPTVPEASRAESDGLRKRLLAGEDLLKFEGTRHRRDGTAIEVDAFMSPLRDSAGKANGIITVVADITAQKSAVTLLRESERRFADVVDAAGEYVWEIDADNRYVFLSGRVEQMLEYDVDEMLGRKLADFWPDGEGARIHAWFESNAPGAQRFHNLEHRALTRSGCIVWQRISGVPVFGPDGKLGGYRGTGLDITERRQADLRQTMEHAVTQVLASAETLAEAAPKILRVICKTLGWAYGAHWRWDQEAQMLRCVETWHIDAVEVAEFVASSSITVNEAPAWQSGSPNANTGGLVRRVWARGAPVWFPDVTREPGFRRGEIAARAGLHCAFAFPVMVGNQPLGVIELFSRHIEEPDESLLQVVRAIGNQIGQFVARREAESAIRAANAELGRKAEDLARSNAELQQFAYVASHDLQEPLRMVSSYTQLIVKRYGGQLDQDAKEFMEFIVDGAARMKRLIEDLLAYSRVGTRGNEFKPTDCEAALRKALINLRGAIEDSGATVTYGALPVLDADGSQLVQLFQNLIGNAIKFKDAAVPRIHVSAEESDAAWVVKVKDNGIGIDPTYFERIFVLFQRLHGKAEYPGTGIGLAICKKIIDRHGGRIWVESEPGHGSTFCCRLPKKIKADGESPASGPEGGEARA